MGTITNFIPMLVPGNAHIGRMPAQFHLGAGVRRLLPPVPIIEVVRPPPPFVPKRRTKPSHVVYGPHENPHSSLPLGPTFNGRMWAGGLWDSCIDGLKSALKKCFGDSSYDEYESLEQRRHAEYRREMSVRRTLEVDVDGMQRTDEQALILSLNQGTEVRHVPRVVVHVVCEMRMKLGLGAMDRSVSGNVALVRAEAARIMRTMNMRRVDAAAHLELVEECFFGENTHFNTTRWRLKAAQRNFITRWLYEKPDNPYGFDC